ncbi:MAG: SRPBCC domain-containing protein [Planctomycetaceae bacterium]
MTDISDLTLDLSQSVIISAAIGDVWKNLLQRLSADSATSDGQPMPLVLEEWPGGRWFRDLGSGQGHLWAFVQVIKPPTILELQGPMFMSYAVAGHIQFKLIQQTDGVELALRHRAMGMIEDEHRKGVVPGWQAILEHVKSRSET